MDADQELTNMIREVVAEIDKEKNPAAAAAPPQSQPLTLNIAGQNMVFQSREELETSLNGVLAAVAAERAQQQQAPPPASAGSFVQGDQDLGPQWKKDEFIAKMTDDPRAGMDYVINHMLFKGKEANATEKLRTMLDEGPQVKQVLASYQFKDAHPEFASAATPQHVQILQNIRTQMGLPLDYDGLEAAYLIGMQRQMLPNFPGLYAQRMQTYQMQQQAPQQQAPPDPYGMFAPPPSQSQQQQYQPQYQQQPVDPRAFNGGFGNGSPAGTGPAFMAPPAVGRGGAQQIPQSVDPDGLDLAQLEKLLGAVNFGNR